MTSMSLSLAIVCWKGKKQSLRLKWMRTMCTLRHYKFAKLEHLSSQKNRHCYFLWSNGYFSTFCLLQITWERWKSLQDPAKSPRRNTRKDILWVFLMHHGLGATWITFHKFFCDTNCAQKFYPQIRKRKNNTHLTIWEKKLRKKDDSVIYWWKKKKKKKHEMISNI